MTSSGSSARKARKVLRSVLGFVVAFPAIVLIGILAIPTAVLAFRGIRKGWPSGLLSLAVALVCLALIVLVLASRGKIRAWFKGLVSKGRQDLEKRIAQETIGRGSDIAGSMLDKGANVAKGAVDAVATEVKTDWDRFVSKRGPDQNGPRATECPACGSFSRSTAAFCSKCGEPLPLVCPKCHKVSRPGARFCDHCGALLTV